MSEVTVIIPTYGRAARLLETIERIMQCEPGPKAIIVHVDQSDGTVEKSIKPEFPTVLTLGSSNRLGPGGGRHKCLLHCETEFAASFDDDSWPADPDYFSRAEKVMRMHSDAAVVAARIWQRGECEIRHDDRLVVVKSFVGCGHVVRLGAYREVRGYLPRPVAYGMEETDLALQLFDRGWQIYQSGEIRVFHDTELAHHGSAENTAGSIANVALFGFLHYPMSYWPRASLQVANKAVDSLRRGRVAGVLSGLLSAPGICWNFRRYRAPLAASRVRAFLQARKSKKLL